MPEAMTYVVLLKDGRNFSVRATGYHLDERRWQFPNERPMKVVTFSGAEGESSMVPVDNLAAIVQEAALAALSDARPAASEVAGSQSSSSGNGKEG